MNELNNDEKKRILLEMLVDLDKFCRKYNIHYFLTGGTLLGSIRHKGFIPWDDDIDVAMLREDYNRFVSIFNNSYSGNIKWIDINNTKNYYLASGKLIDTRTELFENVRCAIPLGLYIDVFPIDNVGNDKDAIAKKISKKMLIERLLPLKNAKTSSNRNWYKNLIIALCKLYPFDERTLARRKIKKNTNIAIEDNSLYVANLYGAWGIKEISLRANFESFIESDFEGHKFFIPVGYDNYLRDIYGDYMKLPPVEKRISHHGNIAYWKNN